MSARVLKRQWIPQRGGSCDIRLGYEAVDEASAILKGAVGKPKRCLVLAHDDIEDERLTLVLRQVADAGFEASVERLASSGLRTLEVAHELFRKLLAAHITSDDLCVAIGDADLLSLASYVLGGWCQGTTVVAFPTDEVALLEGALVPRGLDVDGASEMVAVPACARRVIFDTSYAASPLESESAAYTRALMVAAAMSASERDFQTLWDRAPEIMAGDEDAASAQLLATAKSRGQVVASTAAAIRASIGYGKAFASCLQALVADALPSVCLAEGLRFAARVSVGLEKLSIDDMFAQDELLETLGIGTLSCTIEPDALWQSSGDSASCARIAFICSCRSPSARCA